MVIDNARLKLTNLRSQEVKSIVNDDPDKKTYSAKSTIKAAGALVVSGTAADKLKMRWNTGKATGKSKLATVQYNPGGINTVEAAPLVLDNEIVCAHTCGKLYRLARKSGKILGELDLGSPLLSSPVKLGKDHLMINDFAGRIFIFDIVS